MYDEGDHRATEGLRAAGPRGRLRALLERDQVAPVSEGHAAVGGDSRGLAEDAQARDAGAGQVATRGLPARGAGGDALHRRGDDLAAEEDERVDLARAPGGRRRGGSGRPLGGERGGRHGGVGGAGGALFPPLPELSKNRRTGANTGRPAGLLLSGGEGGAANGADEVGTSH